MDKSLKALQLMLHNQYGIEVRKSELLRYAVSELDMFDWDCSSKSLSEFFDAATRPIALEDTAAEIVDWMVPSLDDDGEEWVPDIDG